MGGAILSLCLEAESQGLGTCILGLYDREKLAGLLGLPVETRFAGLVAVGYPANPQVREKIRRPLAEIARFV